MMSCLFPSFKLDTNNLELIEETWCAILSDYTEQEISIALQSIAKDGDEFAPPVGKIAKRIDEIRAKVKGNELNEMQAWTLVRKALANSTYHAKEEFNKLPQVVQEAVGEPFNLQEWAKADFESVDTVIQSNFMRSYRKAEANQRQVKALPQAIQDRIPVKSLSTPVEAPRMIETSNLSGGMTDEQRERFKHLLGE